MINISSNKDGSNGVTWTGNEVWLRSGPFSVKVIMKDNLVETYTYGEGVEEPLDGSYSHITEFQAVEEGQN